MIVHDIGKGVFLYLNYFKVYFKAPLYVSDINLNGRKNTGFISHVFECIKVIKCGYNSVFEEK